MSARRTTSPPAGVPDVDLTAIAERFATEADTPARPARQLPPGTSTVVLLPLGHEAPTTVLTVSTEDFVSESAMTARPERRPASATPSATIPAAWLAAPVLPASPKRSRPRPIAVGMCALVASALVTTLVEQARRPEIQAAATPATVTSQASIVAQPQWPLAPLRAAVAIEPSGGAAIATATPPELPQLTVGDAPHLPALPTADVARDVAREDAPLRAAELVARDVSVVPPSTVVTRPPEAPAPPEPPIAARPLAVAASAPSTGTEVPRSVDTSQITGLLNGYRGAFNGLDASAAQAVWPTVNHRALDRAFAQLAQQEITFDDCQIDLDGARAAATCHGSARYVPKVGSRRAQSAARQWSFNLQKVDDRWTIEDVATR